MAQSAKKFTYTIRTEYEGKRDIKQLADDLKQLDKIEVLQGAEKAFGKASKDLVDAKKKVRDLRQAMKEPGGEAFAASYAKARKEVTKLNTDLQKQKGRLDKARTSLQQQGVEISKVADKYGDMQAAADKSARAIAARQKLGVRSWREIENEIKGLEKAYRDMEASGEHSMAELAQAQERLHTKTEKLNREMGRTNRVTRKSAGNFRAMEGPLNRMTSSLGTFIGTYLGLAGVIGGGYMATRMVDDVTANAKALENFARTAGMSVPEFDAYAYAVKTIGIEQEKLADISKDVKDKIGDFLETGAGEFKDFFENIAAQAGLTAEELIKLSGPDALIAIKKAMDDVNVSAENQVFYLEAIANDASLLIPLLEDNGKGLKELAQFAKESGYAMSDLDFQQLIELHKQVKEFKDNLGVLRREIVLALAPAIEDMADYFRENKEEIKEFVVAVAEGAGEIAKFVIENREMIATLGKVAIGLLAMNKGLALIGGTGQVIAHLGSMITALKGVQLAALGAATGIGAAAGATLALAGGYTLGRQIDEWQYFNSVVGANKDALAEVPEKFRQISAATGVTIRSFEDLNKAEKDGLIHFDQAVGEWKKGAGEMAKDIGDVEDAAKKSFDGAADNAKDSANKQRGALGKALEEMKKKYKKYVDDIKRLQDQIAGREQDLQAQLREMARSTMTELGAWKDRRKEAEEYYRAAQKAAQAGDFDQAVELADKAKDAFADLNEEVKSGDRIVLSQKRALETASAGVKKAGELAIDVLEKQKKAAREAADELNKQSGGKLGTEHLQDAKKYTVEYGQAVQDTTKHWETQWEVVDKKGRKVIQTIAGDIDKLSGKTIDVYVKYHEKKQLGGPVGTALKMAGGGNVRSAMAGMHFPGYGGGDRRHVIAEDGEYMVRKEMVRAAGLRTFHALNSGRFDVAVRELLSRLHSGLLTRRTGGPISLDVPVPKLSPNVQMLASGGPVIPSPTATGGDNHFYNNVTINAAPGTDGRTIARQVMDELERMQRRSS